MSPYIFWFLNYGGLIGFIIFLVVALGFISQVVSITVNLNSNKDASGEIDPTLQLQRNYCASCKKCRIYMKGTTEPCPDTAGADVQCELNCDDDTILNDCNKCDPIYRLAFQKYERTRLLMGIGAGVAGFLAVGCLILHLVRGAGPSLRANNQIDAIRARIAAARTQGQPQPVLRPSTGGGAPLPWNVQQNMLKNFLTG